MDEIISKYVTKDFGDGLNYCYENGIIYQRDTSSIIDYDDKYFDNYVKRENTEIAIKINNARVALSEKYCNCVLDVGIGSGEFIKRSTIKVYGYDINPHGVQWLKDRGLFVDPYQHVPDEVEGFTLWDTLEHMPNPQSFLKCIKPNEFLIISLPIFDNLEEIQSSKHYKKNEHLLYFSKWGLIRYLDDSDFTFIEYNQHETHAGREGIGSFVFLKN